MLIWFLPLFLIFLLIGLPVFFSLLAAPGILLWLNDQGRDAAMLYRNIYNGIDSFPLMAIPFSLIGGKTEAMKLAWMYMSLPVGIFLLIMVNVELALRNILSFFNSKIDLPLDKDREKLEA